MSFSFEENQAFYLPMPPSRAESLKIVNELKEVLENEKTCKIGQNIKYDMLVLSNYGVEVRGPLFDTLVAHYVLM